MENNPPRTYYNVPPPQPYAQARYLLGMGPMPPPTQQQIAVAVANHLLDNPRDEVEGQFRVQEVDAYENDRVRVCVPVDAKSVRYIDFSKDTPFEDFLHRICLAMNIPIDTARLGWKSNDDKARDPARQLNNQYDLRDAFEGLVAKQNNPRRTREVVMNIVNLAPAPLPEPKKKPEKTTDCPYGEELRVVQEKLRCAEHSGPNRWCYVNPENPSDHVRLGVEEVTLWARKLKDDPTLDRSCVVPPNCLALDKLRDRASKRGGNRASARNPLSPAVHIHNHFTNPFGNAQAQASSSASRGLKRKLSDVSVSSEESTDTEPVLLVDVLLELDEKYPKLNFLQYQGFFEEEALIYAESVTDFEKEYFLGLGIPGGALGILMKGVAKALQRAKKDRRDAKRNKENYRISEEL